MALNSNNGGDKSTTTDGSPCKECAWLEKQTNQQALHGCLNSPKKSRSCHTRPTSFSETIEAVGGGTSNSAAGDFYPRQEVYANHERIPRVQYNFLLSRRPLPRRHLSPSYFVASKPEHFVLLGQIHAVHCIHEVSVLLDTKSLRPREVVVGTPSLWLHQKIEKDSLHSWWKHHALLF